MDTPQGAFSPFFPSQEAVKRQEMGAKLAVEQRNDRILYEIPSSRRTNPPSVWTVVKTKKNRATTGSSPNIKPCQQPLPCPEIADPLRLCRSWINPLPRLERRLPVQALMRTDTIVKKQKLFERALQHPGIDNLPTIERLFQRPKKPFNPAIHPRTPQGGERLSDTAEPKHRSEEARLKNRFVIGFQRPWFPIATDGKKQMP